MKAGRFSARFFCAQTYPDISVRISSSSGALALLQTPCVIYCAIDTLVPLRGRVHPGFAEFMADLDRANIPIVWVTTRTRLQIDEALRKLGQHHPFIAEGGCGVYLPEGYFHLRPSKA